MEKGLEITFNVESDDVQEIVKALANLVGNEFKIEMKLDWRIFHVKLGKEHFYKVCYIGPKMSKLHPLVENRLKARFDLLSHYKKEELLKLYHKKRKNKEFIIHEVKELTEEYDLWSDNFWQYL